MNPRRVAFDTVKGLFMPPPGVRVFSYEPGWSAEKVTVSTVCLEGGHLESPIKGMLDAEHGFETMVFLDGSSMLPMFCKRYKTLAKAEKGHAEIIKLLLEEKLPLAFAFNHYVAWEIEDGTKDGTAQAVSPA